MRYDWRNNSVLFVHNLDDEAAGDRVLDRTCPARPASSWSTCCPRITASADARGRHTLVLEPYGYRWYRVGGLDYLLKRSDIETDATGKTAHPA